MADIRLFLRADNLLIVPFFMFCGGGIFDIFFGTLVFRRSFVLFLSPSIDFFLAASANLGLNADGGGLPLGGPGGTADGFFIEGGFVGPPLGGAGGLLLFTPAFNGGNGVGGFEDPGADGAGGAALATLFFPGGPPRGAPGGSGGLGGPPGGAGGLEDPPGGPGGPGGFDDPCAESAGGAAPPLPTLFFPGDAPGDPEGLGLDPPGGAGGFDDPLGGPGGAGFFDDGGADGGGLPLGGGGARLPGGAKLPGGGRLIGGVGGCST